MKVLIVEDQQRLGQFLERGLKECAYTAAWVRTCKDALNALAESPYDIIVLDLGLPDGDGLDMLRKWRASGFNEPVLILSARDSVEDRIKGLDVGADDYLPKPFELAILIARIRGLLRRKEWLRSSAAPPEPRDSFVFGDKSIHFDLLELRVREQVYPLTVMEASVLRYLVEHDGKTVSRKTMLQDVWGLHEDTDTRAIDNFIVRLRRYLEDDATRPRHLLTVRGVGYRFIAFPPA